MSTLAKISFYNSAKDVAPSGEITVVELCRKIRDGETAAGVAAVRAAGKEDEEKALKLRLLPAVSVSGYVTTGKRKQAFAEGRFIHSGWLQVDIDKEGLRGKTAEEVKAQLASDPHILSAFISPSGAGAKGLFRIPVCTSEDDHKRQFLAVEKYLAEKYQIDIDKSTKDHGRLCYLPSDPGITWNGKPVEFVAPVEVENVTNWLPSAPATPPPTRKRGTPFPEPPEHGIHSWLMEYAWHCRLREKLNEEETVARLESYDGKLRRMLQPNEARDAARTVFAAPLPTTPPPDTKPPRPLSDFIVNHEETLGMTWAEIDNLRPPYVIDGFIRQGEVMLLGAESKSRKSWLAQDAAIAVAAGLPWLADEDGGNGFATTRARAHVIDLELNPSEMRYRFAKARGNRFPDDPTAALDITRRVTAYSFDGMNALNILPRIEEIKATIRPGELVILDCLYRLVPDGNEVNELAAVLETAKRLASETGAAVIVIDHFRKAGDDKARNRFAGSFIKQASASTLVAIEVKGDGVLCLNIDARTFHGTPLVHARFNPETYAFDRVPEADVEAARDGKTRAEMEGWIVKVWRGKSFTAPAENAAAADAWGISRQGAGDRFKKLEAAEFVTKGESRAGGPIRWVLTAGGVDRLKVALGLQA